MASAVTKLDILALLSHFGLHFDMAMHSLFNDDDLFELEVLEGLRCRFNSECFGNR